MDYDDDFIDPATGLWSLEKLKAESAKLEKALAEKPLPKVIILPPKQRAENKKYETKPIHTFK